MISALIFCGHLIFITYIFTKKWQTESLSSAFTNAALIIILFTIGWSITVMIGKLIMEKEGLGIYFDRDSFSLVLLSMIEYLFYRMYYGKETLSEDETEKQ
jgi:hypothetical protein